MSGDHMLRHLRQRADLQRITAAAYDAVPVASAAVVFSRADEFFAQVVLTGFADGTGTVEVIGQNSSGDSISTTLTFTGNQRRQDFNKRFVNISFVNTTGLTNEMTVGNVQVNSVSRTGQPVEEFTVIRQNIPVRFSGLREDERIAPTGGADMITGKVFVSMDGDIRRRDKFLFRGQSFNIRAIRPIYSRNQIRDHRVAIIAAEDQL